MRVSYLILTNGSPVEGALVMGNFIPPVVRTDSQGRAAVEAIFGPLWFPQLLFPDSLGNPISLIISPQGQWIATSDITPFPAEYIIDLELQTKQRREVAL